MGRRSIIIVIAIVVVVLGGVSAYAFVPQVRDWVGGIFGLNKAKTDDTSGNTSGVKKGSVVDLPSQQKTEVGKAIFSGDKETVKAVYDDAISSAKTPADKTTLSIRKAEALAQMDEIDAALQAALDAEKISPNDMGVLSLIATLYEQKNDFKNAAAYYRRVATVAPDETDSGSGTKADYTSKADALENK